jgi:sodium transport system permease protein
MSIWRNIATVWRKEVLDNSRDRRTLGMTLLFGPLFGPIFFAGMINFTVSQQLSSAEEDIEIAIVGAEYAPNLVAFLGSRGVAAKADHALTDFASAASAVRDGSEELVLLIEEPFREQLEDESGAHVGLIFDQSNNRASSKVRRARAVVAGYGRQIGSLRLFARGIRPNVIEPIIVDDFDMSTASGRSALLLGISTYFLLLAPLMGGLYLAIDTTAGERERKSLEPLLTTPVSRSELLLGKLAATITYMTLSLVLTLLSFTLAISFLPLERLGMSSAFGAGAAGAAFFVLLPFLPLGAALMTMVASFSKSYKEAQGYLSMMIIVPTLPLVFASLLNVRPSIQLMLVPSLSQHLLVSNLIRGESLEWAMFAVSAGWTLLLGAVLSWLAIKLFEREAFLA